MNDVNSLSHTKWNCKYHIVFAPKYRRKVFYGEKRREIGEILRTLCNWKKIRIVEAEVCPDHVHMLVEIPPKVAVSSFMGYLKGKSSLMIYEKYPELRYKYRNREFWCRGYYVDTAGKNAKKIEEYIRHQLDEDKSGEQLTGWQTVLARRDARASNIGLCPHKKYPRLCRGIFICCRVFRSRGRRSPPGHPGGPQNRAQPHRRWWLPS